MTFLEKKYRRFTQIQHSHKINLKKNLFNIIRSPRFIICLFLIVSAIVLALLTAKIPDKALPDGLKYLLVNLGSNLLGSVFAFIAFNIVERKLKHLEEQRGVELDGFNQSEFISNIARSENITVQIMDTWMSLLENTQLHDKGFLEKVNNVIEESVNNHNIEFQILLLDPENIELVDARSKEINVDVERELYLNIRSIQRIQERVKNRAGKFNVKLFSSTPSLAMYICPPSITVTFYRLGQFASSGKQLKLTIDSPVGEFIIDRFEEIWQSETTRDLDSCLYIEVEVVERQESYRVKYINSEQGFWIQSSALYRDIANVPDLHIRFGEDLFVADATIGSDLPERIQDLFYYKYPQYSELFFQLHPEKL